MLSTSPAVSEIRAFSPRQDALWLHQLWHRTMHARWSMTLDSMQKVLAGARSLLVAERKGIRLGFCAADYELAGDAGLLVVLVEPGYQRQGIGSSLIFRLQRFLEIQNVRSLHLGASSSGTNFWPGLPKENEAALSFFAKCGWKRDESCADLTQELAHFKTPIWVSDRIKKAEVVLRLADNELRTKVAAFERANFPAWASFICNELADSRDQNILVAQSREGAVLGTILMKAGVRTPWTTDAGVQIGSLNILGVAPGFQHQGIGLALTARAMEILRDRGCSRCYIQWTGLIEWYGKLGATVWADYRRASMVVRRSSRCRWQVEVQPLRPRRRHQE